MRGGLTFIVFLCLILSLPGRSFAQAGSVGAVGEVVGQVLDAETLAPLEGAVVVLRRVEGTSSSASNSSAGSRYRSAVTDARGEYRFSGLSSAAYRLQVRRVGFFADSIEVDLRSRAEARVSVGLEPEPLLLPSIEVLGVSLAPYTRTERGGTIGNRARVAVAQLRQEEYLATDVRELTHGDVVEAATLAETDVFRALQRIPGVSTRDDYTATLWTRGASWDQTRVYFDGLPLYNPTHAGWLFSAVNPDAIGSVTFHPGARSARWGEGAAAVLDLQSRKGGLDGALHGRGELSLASARFALDGRLFGSGLSWMVAGRRTYVDFLTGMYGGLTGDEGDVIPYDFSDLVARAEGELGSGWGYTMSGILEQDRLRGDVAGLLRGNRGHWGNRAGQASIVVPLGRLKLKATAGQTRFRAAILEESDSTPTARVWRASRTEPMLPALESTIRHRLWAAEVSPALSRGAFDWALGYQAVRDAVRYEGPVSLLSALAVLLPRGSAPTGGIRAGASLQYHAFWGEFRQKVGAHLAVEAGARVEVGDSVPNGGPVRVAPRAELRWRPVESTTLTAGWSRVFQYTQDVAPVAGPLGPQLHLSHLWVVAEPERYSAIRADILTAGAEHWLNSDWLGAVNFYRRATSGLAVPNPMPERVTPDRDPDADARGAASGVELSVRRLAGRWTGSVGYTLGKSTVREATVTTLEKREAVLPDFPGPADVRHTLDLTGLMAITDRLRAGGAFTYGSGVPFTQLILPDPSQRGGDVWLGQPNARRTPAYASLDLAAEYTTTLGAWQVTTYLQLRNALDRDNSVTYARSRECTTGANAGPRSGAPQCTQDHFAGGIPRLPLLGVRMSF